MWNKNLKKGVDIINEESNNRIAVAVALMMVFAAPALAAGPPSSAPPAQADPGLDAASEGLTIAGAATGKTLPVGKSFPGQ